MTALNLRLSNKLSGYPIDNKNYYDNVTNKFLKPLDDCGVSKIVFSYNPATKIAEL